MLSRETLEAYRRMTPSERLVLTLQAIREAEPYLLKGSKEVVDRRFELINRENDLRNRAMLEALAKAQTPDSLLPQNRKVEPPPEKSP